MNSEEAWIRKESEKLSFRMHSEEAWKRKERERARDKERKDREREI